MSETVHLVIVSEIGCDTQVYNFETSNEARHEFVRHAVHQIGYVNFMEKYPDTYGAYHDARRPIGVALGDTVTFLREVKIGE